MGSSSKDTANRTVSNKRSGFTCSKVFSAEWIRENSWAENINTGIPDRRKLAWSLLLPRRSLPLETTIPSSYASSAAHQFSDHVGLVLFSAQVEDGNDVGMGAESSHGLGFTLDAYSGGFIWTVGFDQGESNFSVQGGLEGKVDFFLAAFAQEPLDLVAAFGEGGGFG